jgi:hypothetical protein
VIMKVVVVVVVTQAPRRESESPRDTAEKAWFMPGCAHALALMVLGLEEEEGLRTWFPDEFRLSEKRCEAATPEMACRHILT